MIFNSIEFLLFFPIVLCIYILVPMRVRKYVLLIASYFFYMCWTPKYVVLIIVSTITTWLVALGIEYVDNNNGNVKRKKIVLGIGIVINLAILCFFKYINFAIGNLNTLFEILCVNYKIREMEVLLPVGISFYTFQALSYSIDVYRGKVKAEKNILKYALFVSFFPQLVAGPIERSKNLLSQIECLDRRKLFSTNLAITGLKMMIYGYFLKLVVADRVAIYVNEVFGNWRQYNSTTLIIAIVFFAIQIYCDFGSYSLIAIGSAKVLGFELMENFDAPYLSRSVGEFWRRWHISLNSWFRDYLYIPLGGNRCSKIRNTFNIICVFLLSGLWHGANWTYVIWGALNGVYHIIERGLKPLINRINSFCSTKTNSFSYRFLQTLVTFILVDFAWIFFRANSLEDALGIIHRIVTRWDPWVFSEDSFIYAVLPEGLSATEMYLSAFFIIMILVIDHIKYYKKKTLDEALVAQCIWFEYGVYIFLILCIIIFGIYGTNYQSIDFIYFQF